MFQWHSVAVMFKLVKEPVTGTSAIKKPSGPLNSVQLGPTIFESRALNSMSFPEQKPCGCTVLLLGQL